MKKYISIHMVTGFDTETFLSKLNEAITHFQKSGLQVDIQYATTNAQLTALVSAYEEIA